MVDNPDLEQGIMVTYRRKDGEPILDYDFVLHEEYFEMNDEQTELIRETWVREEAVEVLLPEKYNEDA